MNPFPAEFELISLFESEPTLADAGVPWAYNSLTFVTERDRDRVECVIEPGYETLVFRWSREGQILVDVTVHRVKALRVEADAQREELVAEFADRDRLIPLRIRLRPSVHLAWGNSNEP